MESISRVSFGSVHREFRPKVLRYLTGFVGADEAADLTQITMLKVSEHLSDFRGDSSLSTWIYRIATNVAFDRLRQRSPAVVSLDADIEEEFAADVPLALQAPSAETSAARQEMNACVREFVDRLAPNYRAVLVLSDIEGLTNCEIADATGLTIQTVKIRLHRARASLRSQLQAGCTMHHDESNELGCDRRTALA